MIVIHGLLILLILTEWAIMPRFDYTDEQQLIVWIGRKKRKYILIWQFK